MDDICPIDRIGVLGRGKEGPVRMRVLVAYEHRYRLYRESLAREIRLSRPRLEVHHADAGQLAETLRTLDPHVVISDADDETDRGGRAAWIRLPTDPARPTDVCVDGEHEKRSNLGLDELLGVLDEAEERLRGGPLSTGC